MRRILPFLLIFALLLAGCAPAEPETPKENPPETVDLVPPPEEPSEEEPPEEDGGPLPYVRAELGAPASGHWRFPVTAAASDQLHQLVPADPTSLAGYPVLQGEMDSWKVWLETGDGRALCLDWWADGQVRLAWDGQLYDCTAGVDPDALCAFLLQAQLEAVLADIPAFTAMSLEEFDYYDSEDSATRYREVLLDQDQSRQAAELLQMDRWETVDMDTADYLARGWPEFLSLWCEGGMAAKMCDAEIEGTMYTCIFYYIDGREDQQANIFAPPEVYPALCGLFNSLAEE